MASTLYAPYVEMVPSPDNVVCQIFFKFKPSRKEIQEIRRKKIFLLISTYMIMIYFLLIYPRYRYSRTHIFLGLLQYFPRGQDLLPPTTNACIKCDWQVDLLFELQHFRGDPFTSGLTEKSSHWLKSWISETSWQNLFPQVCL